MGEHLPPEVERVLAEHPTVSEVAVIGVPDLHWGEVGKAVVVPASGATVDDDALLAYCRRHLASFKCPATVDVVAELPRNAKGKILKTVLREPFWQGPARRLI